MKIRRGCGLIVDCAQDLEFASIMVQNLNLIMITSPELAEFRKRLRTLESKAGLPGLLVAVKRNSYLFATGRTSSIYGAVSILVAQRRRHLLVVSAGSGVRASQCVAANLVSAFRADRKRSLTCVFSAELEITVGLLIQIDKLVQLLESPVFTALRLQLLEPDKYPYLLKAMYGLLMLLPQSSAFATLRNRLSAVSSLGFLQTVPRSVRVMMSAFIALKAVIYRSYASASSIPSAGGRSTIIGTGPRRTDGGEIRWNELLTHFRQVQKRRASATASMGGEAALDTVSAGQQATAAPISGLPAAAGRGSTIAARRRVPLGARTDSTSTVRGASGTSTGAVMRTGGTATGTGSEGGSVLTRPTSPSGAPKRKGGSATTSSRR